MFRTIILGSCVFVQGLFVRETSRGTIIVRAGSKEFEGKPVTACRKPA